jgi:hypothetical protein
MAASQKFQMTQYPTSPSLDFLKLLQAQLANPESTSLTANNEIGCQPKATTGGAVFGEAAGEPSAPIAALADWFLSDD